MVYPQVPGFTVSLILSILFLAKSTTKAFLTFFLMLILHYSFFRLFTVSEHKNDGKLIESG